MSIDLLNSSWTNTLSAPKKVIFDIAMQLGQIDKLDRNNVLIYITNKIEKIKGKILPREYLMAEKTAQYRCEQVWSFAFLDHPIASMGSPVGNNFIASKVGSIDNTDIIQQNLFKEFLTFYVIQDIINRKKDVASRQIINLSWDYSLPDVVAKSAKYAHIDPKSIHVYKSWIRIDLEEWTITRKDWYQQPRIDIPLDLETHNHPTQYESEETYTVGEDWKIYDTTGKSIGITGQSWHPDPVGEPWKSWENGIEDPTQWPTGNVWPDDSWLFGKQ